MRSAHGDRDAFGAIVARYQALVCSVTWSVCGDLGQSEELAQETFVAAWVSLRSLQDPAKLKPWLCGIARNLAHQAMRRQPQEPTAKAELLDETAPAREASPQETAMGREEAALLWKELERLPETYREPMILYYREEESVRVVADALDLTEDAVRQRLARGRRLLAGQLERVRGDLVRAAKPGESFTQGVLAALPLGTAPAAALIGSMVAKGGAAAKSAGVTGLLNALVGPLLCILLPYLSYRLEMEDAQSPEMRRIVRRFFGILVTGMVLFLATTILLGTVGQPLMRSKPILYIGLFAGMAIAYILFAVGLALWSRQRAKHAARPLREPAFEYRSKLKLLGLPLIHIRIRGGLERGPIKAWIAAGDAAVGIIFAFGGIAIAPVSLGGFAIGLLTWGGFATGLLTFGGFGLGYWSVGGFALGWQAFGGCAIAWLAAMGGTALAHDFAQGAVALAAHANDSAAAAFFHASPFFQNAMAVANSGWLQLANLLWLFPLILWWVVKRRNSRAR